MDCIHLGSNPVSKRKGGHKKGTKKNAVAAGNPHLWANSLADTYTYYIYIYIYLFIYYYYYTNININRSI